MAGYVKTNGAEIKKHGGKILLARVFRSARFFYFTGNRRPVVCGNIEFFDSG